MPLIPLGLATAAVFLAWARAGFPRGPGWAVLLGPLLLWLLAALTRKPVFRALGFVGLVATAAVRAGGGDLPAGLGILALALVAWDAADLWGWRGAPRELRRVMGRGLLRAGLVAGLGAGLAWAAHGLRLRLPFWGLVGLLALAGLALGAWVRGVQGRGGAARGKRSTPSPTK